jgi:hypothetical protein
MRNFKLEVNVNFFKKFSVCLIENTLYFCYIGQEIRKNDVCSSVYNCECHTFKNCAKNVMLFCVVFTKMFINLYFRGHCLTYVPKTTTGDKPVYSYGRK